MAKEKDWAAKLEQQKQMYEAELAASIGAERSVTAEQPTQPQPAVSHVSSQPASLHQARSRSIASAEPGDDVETSSNHAAQITFLKQKVERLADDNAALRKAKVQDPAVVDQKVLAVEVTYKIQMDELKSKIERLADENAALRKAKAQDPAVELEAEMTYKMQIEHLKSKIDTLADVNAGLRWQLQDIKEQGLSVSPLKRTAGDEDGDGSGRGLEACR